MTQRKMSAKFKQNFDQRLRNVVSFAPCLEAEKCPAVLDDHKSHLSVQQNLLGRKLDFDVNMRHY